MSTHAAGSVGAPSIEKTIWRIDPDPSSVEFSVKSFWGIVTVNGRFSRYQGSLDLSGKPAIDLTIEADSLERHPYVRFVSENAALEGGRRKARGLLHARGASMPLDIDATLRRAGDNLEVEAVALADHQLGMTWNQLAMLRTPSKLVVKGRLIRDA